MGERMTHPSAPRPDTQPMAPPAPEGVSVGGNAPPYPAIPKLDPIPHEPRRAGSGPRGAYRYRFPRWSGEIKRPRVCGRFTGKAAVCSSDGTAIFRRWTCGDPECAGEGCFEAWCSSQARHIEDRLQAAAWIYRARRFRHWALSLDEEGALALDHKEMLKLGRRIAEQIMGLKGGALVYHRWRCGHGPRRESPHLHIIGWGWARPSDYVHDKTGWVYKLIAEGEGRERDVAGTARYLLTHAPLIYKDGGANRLTAVRYFGQASGTHIKRDPAEELLTEDILCPLCEAPMVVGYGDGEAGTVSEITDEPARFTRKRRRWRAKVDPQARIVPFACGWDRLLGLSRK